MSDPVGRYLQTYGPPKAPVADPVAHYLATYQPSPTGHGGGSSWGDEDKPSIPSRIAAHLLNTAGGMLPGMDTFETVAGMAGSHLPGLGPPLSYTESADALRGATDAIGPWAHDTERFAGGLAGMRYLPIPASLSPAKASGLVSGASAALDPNPHESLSDRLKNTAIATGVGTGIGKVADMVTTAGRAFLPTWLGGAKPLDNINPTKTLEGSQRGSMAKADKTNYGAAESEGDAATQAATQAKAEWQAVQQKFANTGKQKALPAPGQSEAGKANVFRPDEPIKASLGELQSDYDAQKVGMPTIAMGTVTRGPKGPPLVAPSVDEAAAGDYTSVQRPGEPLPDQPLVADYTRARPVVLRAANDVTVRQPATVPSAPMPSRPIPNPLQDLRSALDSPGVKDVADMVRGSLTHAGADEPTIAMETYRQMSQDEGTLRSQIERKEGMTDARLKLSDLKIAKQRLMDAASGVMPSFPAAVGEHATAMGDIDASRTGADAMLRASRGNPVLAKNEYNKGQQSFGRFLANTTPQRAGAAAEGILSRTAAMPKGIRATPMTLSRAAPLLRAADAKSGKFAPQLLRAGAIAAGRTAADALGDFVNPWRPQP